MFAVVDQGHVPAAYSPEKPFRLVVVDQRQAHLVAHSERRFLLRRVVDVAHAQADERSLRHSQHPSLVEHPVVAVAEFQGVVLVLHHIEIRPRGGEGRAVGRLKIPEIEVVLRAVER